MSTPDSTAQPPLSPEAAVAPPRPSAIGLLAAGVCVDLLARWLRPTSQRLMRWRVFAALAPLATWTIFIATAYLTAPALAPPEITSGHPEAMLELTTGAPIVQALVGLLVSFMLVPGGPPPAARYVDVPPPP